MGDLLRFLICASALLGPSVALGWYGPICYSDKTTQVVLTLPSIAGETPGDVRVDYDDNEGRIERHEVRASKSVNRAHEVVLIRGPGNATGVVGVIVTSMRSTTGYKFELDFQKDPAECHGAIVKASDQGAPRLALAPRPRSKPIQKAVARVEEEPAIVTTAAVNLAPASTPAVAETQKAVETTPTEKSAEPTPAEKPAEVKAPENERANPVPAELPDVQAPVESDTENGASAREL